MNTIKSAEEYFDAVFGKDNVAREITCRLMKEYASQFSNEDEQPVSQKSNAVVQGNYYSVCNKHDWVETELTTTIDGEILRSTTCRNCGVSQQKSNTVGDECYFTHDKKSTSATICVNCGREKIVHTIGEGIKVTKVVYNENSNTVEEINKMAADFCNKNIYDSSKFMSDETQDKWNNVYKGFIAGWQAKQQPINKVNDIEETAIDFAKWIHTNYATTHSMKWIKRNVGGDEFSTRELYEQYLKNNSQ